MPHNLEELITAIIEDIENGDFKHEHTASTLATCSPAQLARVITCVCNESVECMEAMTDFAAHWHKAFC